MIKLNGLVHKLDVHDSKDDMGIQKVYYFLFIGNSTHIYHIFGQKILNWEIPNF